MDSNGSQGWRHYRANNQAIEAPSLNMGSSFSRGPSDDTSFGVLH